ncbi:MAG: Mov34/MPN/PAD-1 family protein [Novosphingobium sp.]
MRRHDCRDCAKEAARARYPREACGSAAGPGGAIELARPCANVHSRRRSADASEIDPAALIAAHKAAREGGPQVLGYYHSHPNGRAGPSAEDRAEAAGDGRIWAIVANGGVSWWRDGAKRLRGASPATRARVRGYSTTGIFHDCRFARSCQPAVLAPVPRSAQPRGGDEQRA